MKICRKTLAPLIVLMMQWSPAAASDLLAQNPAGMTELPKTRTLLPSVRLERQPLEGDFSKYERTILRSEPIKLGALIQIASMQPHLLDAKRNRTIDLKESLEIALKNNLSIKISEESALYQKTQFFYYLSFLAPTFSTSYALTSSNINDGLTHTNADVFSSRLTFPLFAGGSYTQFIVSQSLRAKGWKQATLATKNDTLLDVYTRYTNLVLNHHLLRINGKAVELSKMLLNHEQNMFKAGKSTKYLLLTAESNLKSDEQALIEQQVATRKSSLQLSYSLDLPLSVNLVPTDIDVQNGPLLRGRPKIDKLLAIAYENRPELREYEYFRLSTKRDIQAGMAPLYPTLSAFLAYTRSNLTYSGSTDGLAGAAVSQISAAGFTSTSTSNTALGQTASLSPEDDSTANDGANTSSSTVVASSGGTPMANVQSGSLVTSGSVAPSIISPISLTGSSTSNINGTNTASSGTSPGVYNTLQAGMNLNWTLPNSGLNSAANIVALRALARQAHLQANQQLLKVGEAVRTYYTSCLSSMAQIESSASALDSNEEGIKMAEIGLKSGTVTIQEFEKSKADYVGGLSIEAQSIIGSKQSEAKLLHAIGVISVDSLCNGVTLTHYSTKRSSN